MRKLTSELGNEKGRSEDKKLRMIFEFFQNNKVLSLLFSVVILFCLFTILGYNNKLNFAMSILTIFGVVSISLMIRFMVGVFHTFNS